MQSEHNVWVVDDDSSIRWVLEKALSQNGVSVKSFESADRMLEKIDTEQPDVIISDIRMPGTNGLDALSRLTQHYPDLPVIITTAHSDL